MGEKVSDYTRPDFDVTEFRVELQKMQVRFGARIPDEFLMRPSTTIEVYKELARRLVVVINAWVLGKEDSSTEMTSTATRHESVPVTWVDHLLQEPWVPKWIVRRWPPKTRDIATAVTNHVTNTTITKVCPHIDPDIARGSHIEFFTLEPKRGQK